MTTQTTTLTRPATTSPTEALGEQNVALVRRAFAMLMQPPERRDAAKLASLLAPDFEAHGPGRDGCDFRRELFDAFTDPRAEISKVVASGDRVITHISFSGQHTGRYQSQEPTGRRMTADGIVVHRLRDGLISEQWSVLRWR